MNAFSLPTVQVSIIEWFYLKIKSIAEKKEVIPN